MNEQFKPFRLINDLELKILRQCFASTLQAWNEHYALFPLSLSLDTKPALASMERGYLWVSGQHAVALMAEQDLSALSYSLFGDAAECFHAISEVQLINLLSQVLAAPSLQRQSLEQQDLLRLDEWFYPGSPALKMSLSTAMHSLTLYLHPQWVLQALPQYNRSRSLQGCNKQDALAAQVLHCQVELDPVVLPLNELLHLRVGDVIKTDQVLSTPLILKHQQQALCRADLGATNHHKSIQIASLL